MLIRCNGCGERPENKLTQVNWSWRRADGFRVAYRARLCVACFATKVAPLAIDYTGNVPLTCPGCGIDTEQDMDAIYTTNFIPSYGEYRTESPFCGPCAASYRIWVLDHSWQLDDQRGAAGGPSTPPDAETILRDMGLPVRGN